MSESVPASNFIRQIIEEDLRSGRHQQVVTRFPPEPNGFLHIGHAKAICISFGMAREFGGRCHLRMDDTNPLKEKEDYVQAMIRDIRWLGFDWGEHFYHASDYFDTLFDWAKLLIRKGLAYVDEQNEEQIRASRGTVDPLVPGTPSPWRERPAEESLKLLDKMAQGDFPDGAMVLRAKIDMGHENALLRDPLLYRIRNASHHRTGDRWHVYPLYDWAHGQSDAIEGVTHSLCSLEFDVHRPLYDWFLEHLPVDQSKRPRQYEFAKLKISGTMTSKRKLLAMVEEKIVEGWDDPRMPTLAGLRRRGIPPSSILALVERLGVAKADSLVEPAMFDNIVRDELNSTAPRVLVVLDPVELVIEDWPEDKVDTLDAPYWPHDVVPVDANAPKSRPLLISRRVFLEREDFAKVPPPGFKRLAPGRTVRLRHGPIVTCTGFEEAAGKVTRIRATHASADAKISATIHWVSAAHAVPVEARLYGPLFLVAEPGKEEGKDFRQELNPDSLKQVNAMGEASLAHAKPGERFQFERQGYFYVDAATQTAGKLIVNRTVALKDTWAKVKAAAEAPTEKFERPVPGKQPVKTERKLGEVGHGLVAAGLSEDEASVLEADEVLRKWYHAALAAFGAPKAVAGWVVTELSRVAKDKGGLENLPFGGPELGRLVQLVAEEAITGASGKVVLEAMAAGEGHPDNIVSTRGLAALTDRTAVAEVVREVLSAHPDRVAAYKGGRTGLVGFFVGQVIQKTNGRAEPGMVRALLDEQLR